MYRARIAVAATLFAFPAWATNPGMQMTGASFSDACTRAHESWVGFCNGYIQAAVDSLRASDGICIPSGATRTDLVTITEATITASNQLKALNAHDAVRLVLRRAFPCS